MAGLKTDPSQTIREIINLLRDRYQSGFPILKELIQNADDARATRLVVAGLPGIPNARNPLLRSPGLLVANDGPLENAHLESMQCASGSSKTSDLTKIGRFGLGQKALFHLCDAFLVQGRTLEDASDPTHIIINPFVDLHLDANSADGWDEGSSDDIRALEAAFRGLGFGDLGVALYVPFRSESLLPAPGHCFTKNYPTHGRVFDDFDDQESLISIVGGLRYLQEIKLRSAAGKTVHIRARADKKLAGSSLPLGKSGEVEGIIDLNGQPWATFVGRELHVDKGEAVQLRDDPRWPATYDLNQERVLEKAFPHGAAIFTHSVGSTDGCLYIHWAVFLPTSDDHAVAIELDDPTIGRLDLLLHGYFFVDSGRRHIDFDHSAKSDDEQGLRFRWNDAIRREITLPLMPTVTRKALDSFELTPAQKRTLVRSISQSAFWSEWRATACLSEALAECVTNEDTLVWQVVANAQIRPLPPSSHLPLSQLVEMAPTIFDWASDKKITLACDPRAILSDRAATWSPTEVAELIQLLSTKVFQRDASARACATLLEVVLGDDCDEARSNLRELFRKALIEDDSLAAAEPLSNLTGRMPPRSLMPLPASVEHRTIFRTLAQIGGSLLAVRRIWAPDSEAFRLSDTQLIDWLTAIEPLLSEGGELGEQANTAAASLIAAGPPLSDYLSNERARGLRVLRARNIRSGEPALLTITEFAELSEAGLLFRQQPGKLLSKLTDAVDDIEVYELRLPADLDPNSRISLQSAIDPNAISRVVRRGQRFGSSRNRSALIQELLQSSPMDVDAIRVLCVGEASIRHTRVDLLALGTLPPALEAVAAKCIGLLPDARLVSPEIADQIARRNRDELGIQEIDLARLGGLIRDALRAGELKQLSGDDAQALLASGLPEDLLAELPLHRTEKGEVVLATELFRQGEFAFPSALAGRVKILVPWDDPRIRQVQYRLVTEWTARTQIEWCLSQVDPSEFALQIMDGLAAFDGNEVRGGLRQVAWLPTEAGAIVSGDDVLLFSDEADQQARMLLGDGAFVPFGAISPIVRDHSAADTLRSLLPDERESIDRLELLIEDNPCAIGCIVDGPTSLEDLRALSRGTGDLGLPGWPLLRCLLKTIQDDGLCASLIQRFCKRPTAAQLVAHLNELAELASDRLGLAARRMHGLAYAKWFPELSDGSRIVFAELLLPSRAGTWRVASDIAVWGLDLTPEYQLDDAYADLLETGRRGQPGPFDPSSLTPSLTNRGDSNSHYERLVSDLRLYLEPWRGRVPSDAIIFLLGLLGRQEPMRVLAREWERDARRSHQLIWQELDDALGQETGADGLYAHIEDTCFSIEYAANDEVVVTSAAGSLCTVPLAKGAQSLIIGDPMARRSAFRDTDGNTKHHVPLTLAKRVSDDRGEARELLEQFIDALRRPLFLNLVVYHDILRAQFEASFAIDQATLDDTIAELKDQCPSLLGQLSLADSTSVKEALDRYRIIPSGKGNSREIAKENLWNALHDEEAQGQLLEAIRGKIEEMGYDDDRVLFELFQNADDAYVQLGTSDGEFVVEVDGDESLKLRSIHWGRPINQLGPDLNEGKRRSYHRDLYNMLAISHSEKAPKHRVTGRFGLGFKTVHMLANEVGIASAFLSARVRGGMIPDLWGEGFDFTRAYVRGPAKPTLVELRIPPDRRDAALVAVKAFEESAAWLTAIAKSIRRIQLVSPDGESHWICEETPLQDGLELVKLEGSTTRRALRLDLGEGFSILVGIGRSGPEGIRTRSCLWNLVPLAEQRTSNWILNGPFDVDPGRSQIKGGPEEQEALFARLGEALGERLVQLFDMVESDWEHFAATTDIHVEGRLAFWDKLAGLFEPDLAQGREKALHLNGRGLGRLFATRPGVATKLLLPHDRPVRADDASFRLAASLEEAENVARIGEWPSFQSLAGQVVSKLTGDRLQRLGWDPQPLTVVRLMSSELGPDRRIGVELASRLGAVLTQDSIQNEFNLEGPQVRELLRDAAFLAADGSWQLPRRLSIPMSTNEDERARASFVNDDRRLSQDYSAEGVTLFELARAQSGYTPNADSLRRWASELADPVRQQAFLRYLNMISPLLAQETVAKRIYWLPEPLVGLRDHPLCAQWSPHEVESLLWRLGMGETPLDQIDQWDDQPPRPDLGQMLRAIHAWWGNAKADEVPSYNRRTYPESFAVERLKDSEDREAWFTMFSLGIFHTLGRVQESQGRSFVQAGMQQGWWSELAALAEREDVTPWISRIEAWSDPYTDQNFLPWRRCLVDLYAAAKYLPEYVFILQRLPRIVAAEGDVSLTSLFQPHKSQIAGRMGVVAAPINRSLGIGMNWIVRELTRNGIYVKSEVEHVVPVGWSSTARIRRLFRRHGIELGENAHPETSKVIYDTLVEHLGETSANFHGDLDLPLQLISRADYCDELRECLEASNIELDPEDLNFDDE